MTTLLEVGGDQVDLDTLPPMTLGVRMALFSACEMDYCNKFTPKGDVLYCLFMLRKIRPQTTMSEVAALPLIAASEVLNAEMRVTKHHFNPAYDTFDGRGGMPNGFVPEVSQKGKDVIWWPTPPAIIETMLDMAGVTAEDNFIDLGSGDGRMVIAAAKRGCRAHGVEFDKNMVDLAQWHVENEQIETATFSQGDLFDVDLSSATVVSLYLLPDLNLKLRPSLLKLKKGTRIVSHQFDMGSWVPDKTIIIGAKKCHLWTIK